MIRKLRDSKESVGLKREILVVFFAWIIFLPAGLIVRNFEGLDLLSFVFYNLAALFSFVGGYGWTTWRTIVLQLHLFESIADDDSESSRYVQSDSVPSSVRPEPDQKPIAPLALYTASTRRKLVYTTQGFDAFLRDPAAREEFADFLRSEWSLENLLFFDDVQKLAEITEQDAFNARAYELYVTYFESTGMRINVSSACLRDTTLKAKKTELSRDIYENACNEVVSLMYQDSYLRYCQHRRRIERANSGVNLPTVRDTRSNGV